MKIIKKTGCIPQRFCAAVLAVLLVLAGTFTLQAAEQNNRKVIRVGRFPYEEQMYVDAGGSYSGYGYDYLQEIAHYTGWTYEFVDAPWNECLAMLERGELDLIGAVMRSPEREIYYDFSEFPMLSGYGVLVTPLENSALPYEDFQAFDGLKTGVLNGNQHAETFMEYSRTHGFTPELHFYDTQNEVDEALAEGKIDAMVATNILHSDTLRVVATFGENDAYFATTKGNTGILDPLNEAMRQISLNDPYFNSRLDQKYFNLQASTVISFTKEELEFIQNSSPVPLTYIPQVPPFNTCVKSSGNVEGIAVDVCRLLEERTGLTFQWINPESASDAAKMLRQGEALVIPAKYDDSVWAGRFNARLTQPYLQGQMVMVSNSQPSDTEIVALYDEGSQSSLAAQTVSADAQIREYNTVMDCMDAVLHNEATTTYINSTVASYMMNNPVYSSLHTTTLYGYPADVAMAVSNQADPLLLSVLDKGLRSISETQLNQSILLRMKQPQMNPLAASLYENPVRIILLVVSGFALLIAALLILLGKMHKTLYTDELTGYPNYRALARDAIRLIGSHPEQYALVYMDIRRFKVINDTFGYKEGDRVLKATAALLMDDIGSNERAARIHADIFALLLHCEKQAELQKRLNLLSEKLGGLTFSDPDRTWPLYKGGVYPLNKDFDDLEVAFDRAHFAKDSITHLFSNTFVFYDDVIHIRVLQEKELEDSMYSALSRQEFVPYYQPKVNAVTEKVVGAEALVRWLHPEKGCLLPGEFVPFYEKNGFIVNIDLTVFEQVCRDLSQWIQRGIQIAPVSVNLSRRNIQNRELPCKLKEIADRYQVPSSFIELEVTETEELEDLEDAVVFVENLRSYGFKISVDDYGTGYSSISFLQQLPMDALKLDRKFIMNAMQSGKAEDIMRYLITTMQKNGIRILCEGIETEKQRDFVIGLDCRFIQGFLYSSPLSKEKFEAYLLEHGVELPSRLDNFPIVDFENNHLVGGDDFLIRTMPSWVFACILEPGYPVTYISPNLLEELGYGQLEFKIATGGLYINSVHPDDRPEVLELLQQEDVQSDLILQYRILRKDGSSLWVREVTKRVLSADGREALLGVCTNISDIILLEAQKSRLIEAIPGGVAELLLREDGPVIQQASEPFYEIIGHTQQEMEELDNNLYHIISAESLTEVKNMLQSDPGPVQDKCERIIRFIHKDGNLHWVSCRCTLSDQQTGRMATVIIHNSDQEVKSSQMIAAERAKLELALSLTGQALFEYDIQTKNVTAYSGFAAYGFPDGSDITMKESMSHDQFLHPEDATMLPGLEADTLSADRPVSFEVRARNSIEDTVYYWIRVTICAVPGQNGRPACIIGAVENINQQKRFEIAFQQEAQYREAFTESSLMAYEINLAHNTIQRISGSRGFRLDELCQSIPHPYQYTEAMAAAIPILVAQEDRGGFAEETLLESLSELYRRGVSERELEYRRVTWDNQVLWTSALIHLMMDQLSGDIIAYVYHRDIGEKKAAEQELIEQAEHDPLTGADNRITAEHRIQEIVSRDPRPGCIHAFLMMDVNRFKAINDTYGHLVGDQCLTKMAEILRANVWPEDIVARMGGDEFAILLTNRPDENTVYEVKENIARQISSLSYKLKINQPTRASIGIALVPKHGTDFETLYRYADREMYMEKLKSDGPMPSAR